MYNEICQIICKPGSVIEGHFSRLKFTFKLKRLARRPTKDCFLCFHRLLYLTCPSGFAAFFVTKNRWALTSPFHPCLDKAVIFCGTFLRHLQVVNWHVFMEPGLSSIKFLIVQSNYLAISVYLIILR